MSLVRSDGFCIIPQNSEGVEANETVSVRLVRPKNELEKTIVSIGSHDMILDIINDISAIRGDGFQLSSSHTGSLAGLMSLKKGECHLAPVHLLSPDGTYNVSSVKKMIKEPAALIKGVTRIQGIMVPKGNPKNIKGISDLESVSFINRQRGAGTRLLLDYMLDREGIDRDLIKGYEREATTHMAVAAAVKSGSCDCGLGVYSAASALGLDFIPVGEEEYDFAVMQRYLELDNIQKFIDMLRGQEFSRRLDELGGYGLKNTGEVILID